MPATKTIPKNVICLPADIVKAIKKGDNRKFPGDYLYDRIKEQVGTNIFASRLVPEYYSVCFTRFYAEHSHNLTGHQKQILRSANGAQAFVEAAEKNMYAIVTKESQFKEEKITDFVINVAKEMYGKLKRGNAPLLTIAAANAIADLWQHTRIEEALADVYSAADIARNIQNDILRSLKSAGLY